MDKNGLDIEQVKDLGM